MKNCGRPIALTLIMACLSVFEAAAMDCRVTAKTFARSSGAVVVGEATVLGAQIPATSTLEARARECSGDSKKICIRNTNAFDILPSEVCTVALYACPAIVRSETWVCRRHPTFVKQRNSSLSNSKTVFKSILKPIRLDSRKRQTQVSFQTVSTCPNGSSTVTITSNVAGVNVTCKNGVSMNDFMKSLPKKTT